MKYAIRTVLRELGQAAIRTLAVKKEFEGPCGLILNYHSVISKGEPRPFWRGLAVPEEEFENQISWLSRRLRIVDMRQFLREFREGFPINLPVTLTFDDGWRDNLIVAAPILKRFNLPASMFLATGNVESGRPFWWVQIGQQLENARAHSSTVEIELGTRRFILRLDNSTGVLDTYNLLVGYVVKNGPRAFDSIMERLGYEETSEDRLLLNWEEVSALEEEGWSFGAHTVNHVILARVSLEESKKEILDSGEALWHHVRDPLPVFCFPNGAPGDFLACHVQELKKMGIQAALTTVHGAVTPHEDPFSLPRLKVDGDYRWFSFHNLVTGRYRALYDFVSLIRNPVSNYHMIP